jgi:cell division protein ZapA (FtsZ GTPase activity inhibitor)
VDRLVRIELFGQAYTFKASGEVSEAQEVADYLTKQVEKAQATAESPSKLDAVILAALNIANDYFRMRRSREDLSRDIDGRCNDLIAHIDANT